MQPPKPRASWILNQPLWIAGSLVLQGPRLHSYCLLWFIRRCTWLFDVSSREVLHLLEKWGRSKLWNKMWICQNGSDRWICDVCWVCVHREVTLFCQKTLALLKSVLAYILILAVFCFFWGGGRRFNINYASKIGVKKECFHQRILVPVTYQRLFFFPLLSLFFCQFELLPSPPLPLSDSSMMFFSFFIHLF